MDDGWHPARNAVNNADKVMAKFFICGKLSAGRARDDFLFYKALLESLKRLSVLKPVEEFRDKKVSLRQKRNAKTT